MLEVDAEGAEKYHRLHRNQGPEEDEGNGQTAQLTCEMHRNSSIVKYPAVAGS